MKGILLLIGLFLIMGCDPIEPTETTRAMIQGNKDSIKRCLGTGGMPIFSAWNHQMKRCDYPPKVTK